MDVDVCVSFARQCFGVSQTDWVLSAFLFTAFCKSEMVSEGSDEPGLEKWKQVASETHKQIEKG